MNDRLSKLFSRDGKDHRWSRNASVGRGPGQKEAVPSSSDKTEVQKTTQSDFKAPAKDTARPPRAESVENPHSVAARPIGAVEETTLLRLRALTEQLRVETSTWHDNPRFSGALTLLKQAENLIEQGMESAEDYDTLVELFDDLDAVVVILAGKPRGRG